jgi:hypothetical protein
MSESTGAASVAPTLPELADGIRAELGAIADDNRSSLTHAIRAGELLIEAKDQTEHGGWLPWLTANFDLTTRTAQSYMGLAANAKRVSHLGSVREALAALAADKPKRKAKPPKQTGEATVTGRPALSHDPAVINWVRAKIRARWNRDRMVKASIEKTDGWPRPEPGDGNKLSNGTYSECRAAIVAEDRVRKEARAPKKRKATEGGKRLRQLHADKRAGERDSESDVFKLEVALAEAISLLERYELPEMEWTEELDARLNEIVYQLERLQTWWDLAWDATWARMDDVGRQRTIRTLEARANDPSSNQHERETAARLAEKRRERYRTQKAVDAG